MASEAGSAEPALISACVHSALNPASAPAAGALAGKATSAVVVHNRLLLGALVLALAAGGVLVRHALAEDLPRGLSTVPIRISGYDARGDWPGWRGPDRNGVAPTSPKLLDAWPAAGPTLVWKNTDRIPRGWGSPVV